MVMAGRPRAAELASAWSSCGSGLRRLIRAWASILLAWSSLSTEDILGVGGLGIRVSDVFGPRVLYDFAVCSVVGGWFHE